MSITYLLVLSYIQIISLRLTKKIGYSKYSLSSNSLFNFPYNACANLTIREEFSRSVKSCIPF